MEKQNTDNKFLGTEKVGKLLRMFAIPCVLSLIIQALYNIVDQIFIAQSGYLPLGNNATGVVYPLTVIALALGLFIGDGVAAMISINQGKNKSENTHKAIGTGLTVGLGVSIILMGICFGFARPILDYFGAEKASCMTEALEYSTFIFIGFPAFILACILNPVIRADGRPKYAMFAMAIGAVVNIILDPIFIFMAHMGMNGAALATFIGQIISLIFHLAYLFKSKNFRLKFKSFIPDFKMLFESLKLGISSFLTQISIVIITIVNNRLLVQYFMDAEKAIGIFTVAFKIFGIIISIVIGIASGGQPIIGYNYGAKKYDRVKATLKWILICTAIVGIIATILFEAFPRLFLDAFNYKTTNCSLAEQTLGLSVFRIYMGFILLTCFIKAISIFFQAIGMPVRAMLISLLRDVIFVVPLAYLLPLADRELFYWSAPISDILTFVIATILTIAVLKKLSKTSPSPSTNSVKILPSKGGIIVTISREHGAGGREIGQKLAQKLGVPFYDKELTALAAQESGLAQEYIEKIEEKNSILYELYLSTEANQTAIKAQENVLKEIAEKGSCVIVGRAADYVLKDYNPFKVFIYAPNEFRQKRIMANYGDSDDLAKMNMEKADKRRARFYENITGQEWGDAKNYNLSIDSSIGIDKVVEQIAMAVQNDRQYVANGMKNDERENERKLSSRTIS